MTIRSFARPYWPARRRSRWQAIARDGLTALAAGLAVTAAVALSGVDRRRGKGSSREAVESDERDAPGRAGANAADPLQVPTEGWLDIAKRTYREIERDRVFAVAAGVTFYGLLAFVPALAAFVSVYGLIADPSTVFDHLSTVSALLPADAYALVRDQAVAITQGGSKIGFALIFSLGLSIWSANSGMKAVFDALNVAYGEAEKRGFIRLNLVSLACTAGVLAFALFAIAAVAAVPIVLEYLYLGATTEWLLWLGRWPLLFGAVLLGLAVLYRYGPSRNEARWSWVSPGAIFAATAWIGASLLFSWYVANFEDYNRTYGALGAVVGLLMWMWISASIVLIGAELNSEAERQTLEDTTDAPRKPLGARGADAADNKS